MKKLKVFGKIVFGIVFLSVIIYGILGVVYYPQEREITEGLFMNYTQNWCVTTNQTKPQQIAIPTKLDIERGTIYQVENTLPEVTRDDMYVIFRTARQDIRVFIDETLRMEYTTDQTRQYGKYSPTYYVMVPLTKEDSNKKITAEYQVWNKNSGVVGEIYYANKTGFLQYELRQQGGVFVIGVIMLIVSSITLLASVIMSIVMKKQNALMSISIAILGVTIWIMTNSVFRQFLVRNISAISDVSFVILPLTVAAFSTYVNQVTKGRYIRVYDTISGLSLVVAITTSILHITRVVDYMESFGAIAFVFVSLLLAAIVTFGLEARRGYMKEYMMTAISLMIAGGCMMVQMIIYLKGGKAYDVTIASIGLFVMLVLATINTIRDVYNVYKERDRVKYESETKSQFLANMSHEIRTPINAVLGMNTMIQRTSREEEVLGYADNIERAGQNLLSIVNDILDLSKIESGKMELVPVSYAIADLLRDLYQMMMPKVKEKNLKLEFEIEETIPNAVYGDDVRLKQILVNLMTNAIKYTKEGKVSLQLSQKKDDSLQPNQISLHFAVSDTGSGIKQEDIGKLTEKFVRIEESKNRNIEGTGLGINIIVSLLQMMNTSLKVDSVYGEGSCFSFDLVMKVTNTAPIGRVEDIVGETKIRHEEYVAKLCIKDARLLVVDDNRINRMVFKGLTKNYQCQVDEAESGKQCLELVKTTKYDLIFMDHMMPEMDGVETFEKMRSWSDYCNVDTPVVILTANAIQGAEEEYLKKGFDSYLAKPIDPAKLEECIRKYV